jgi:hypothetical protein
MSRGQQLRNPGARRSRIACASAPAMIERPSALVDAEGWLIAIKALTLLPS